MLGDGRIVDEVMVKIDVPAGVHEGSYITYQDKEIQGKGMVIMAI